MSKSAKQIIVILILLLGVSAFMAVWTYNEKSALEKSRAALQQQLLQQENEKKEMAQQIQKLRDNLQSTDQVRQKLEKEMSNVNRQISEFTDQITTLKKERDEWKARIEGVRQERDDLMAKLQAQPAAAQSSVMKASEMTSSDDSFMPDAGELHWARVLKEKASLEVELEKLQNALTEKAVQFEELKKKTSDLELELGAIKSRKEEEVHELQMKAKSNEELANNLAIELAREKNDKKLVVDRLDKFKEQNEEFRSQIKKLTGTKIALEKSLAQLSEDKNALEKKLIQTKGMIANEMADMTSIKQGVDRKLKEVDTMKTKEVELPPIIVSASGTGSGVSRVATASAPMGSFHGKVVSVNEDNNFVIVDIGENDGLKLGDTLSIYRNDKPIGGVEVIQVRKSIAAADIKNQSAKIKAGDTVR